MSTQRSDSDSQPQASMLRLGADISSAYLAHNTASQEEVAAIVASVVNTLHGLGKAPPAPAEVERPKPAVPVGRSIQDDYIVCLEDGKKLKMLKRYLASHYGLSPDDYRRRWNLAPDYPMVAPSYATRRSEFARQLGLGRGVRGRGRSEGQGGKG